MTLRVLPRLTMAVTEPTVGKRKRLSMLLAGLVAFAAYRLASAIGPISDILTLLGISGALSAIAAAAGYRAGRGLSLRRIWAQDAVRLLGWITGWVGFLYGVQLSLMVLALLKVLIRYDFLEHPEGPAMMAIVIACTSVFRDAFEIGHIRSLQAKGEPVLTFPDGRALWRLLLGRPAPAVSWSLVGGISGMALAGITAQAGDVGRSELVQLAAVALLAGSLALLAFLAGTEPDGSWRTLLPKIGAKELFRFWWWPGLTFGATYFLVLTGLSNFVLRAGPGLLIPVMVGGIVAGMMTLYCFYLGHRRQVEDRVQQTVPASLLRCPFITSLLARGKPPMPVVSNRTPLETTALEWQEAKRSS